MKRLNPKRGGWKREGVVGGGFKGTRVGGGGESGSARPQTDGGQRWAPGAAHKGERRGPARVPGEEKTAPGPNPLGSHNGVFHGVSGGAAEADAGRRRRCPLAGAEPRAPPPPRTPKGPALGWGRSGRRRRVGARGARRLLVGQVCGSGARRRGRKGRARFGRGGRGRERGGERGCKAAAGEAGARVAGGRAALAQAPRAATTPLREPEPGPQIRKPGPGTRAAAAPVAAPLLPPAPPRSRPLPLGEERRGAAGAAPEEAAAAAPPPVRAAPEPPRRAVCVRVCRALAPCLAHA